MSLVKTLFFLSTITSIMDGADGKKIAQIKVTRDLSKELQSQSQAPSSAVKSGKGNTQKRHVRKGSKPVFECAIQ